MIAVEAAAAMRLLDFPTREALIAAGRAAGVVIDLRPHLQRRAMLPRRPTPGAAA